MKIKKSIVSAFSVALVALGIGGVASQQPVSAGNGAGGGGASGGGVSTWYKKHGNDGAANFRNWMAQTNTNMYKFLMYVTNRNEQKACYISKDIYYTSGDGPNYWHGQGNGTNHNPRANIIPKYLKDWLGQRWTNGHITVICSAAAPGGGEKVEKYKKSDTETRGVTYKGTISGVHDSATVLNPEKTDEFGSYTPTQKANWNSMHEQQVSEPVVNKFGKWVDEMSKKPASGSVNTQAEIDKIVNEGKKLQKGDYVAHPTITMSQKNRDGFARGGVITVQELRRNVTAEVVGRQGQSRKWTQDCEKRTNLITGKVTNTCKPKKYTAWKATSSTLSVKKAKDKSLLPYSYWQMINTRCNVEGINSVASNVKGFTKNPYANGKGSASGYTRQYVIKNDPLSKRPLGNSLNSNPTLKETGHDSFYNSTKSCGLPDVPPSTPQPQLPIDCTSVLQQGANNASAKNVNSRGQKRNGTYGAQADMPTGDGKTERISSDTFAFFRDGEQHQLRTDLWYPVVRDKNAGITVNSADPAMYTRIMFDPQGTPVGSDKTLGETFGLAVGSKGSSDVLTDADVKKGTSYTSDGEITMLYPHAIWPSDTAHPEKMNIDWTWTPEITNNVLTEVNGAGANPAGTKTDKSKIMSTCSIRMNSTQAQIPYITNSPWDDLKIQDLKQFDGTKDHYSTINFVRSSSNLN